MRPFNFASATSLLFGVHHALAIELNLDDETSIKNAAKTIAANVVKLYPTGPGTSPGVFAEKYYWWEAGLAFDSLVNYWSLTGDDEYVEITQQALLFQVGPQDNYMPTNQTKSLGNSDQSAWALAAMTAAERGFPMANGQNVSWVQLAANAFDSQVELWDQSTCNGGLRWQKFTFSSGYDYKNSESNGEFTELAGRLARFTGNQTYADWAVKSYNWSQNIGLVNVGEGLAFVYDGTNVAGNCSKINQQAWSQNAGIYLSATAYMSNFTNGSSPWLDLEQSFTDGSIHFFAPRNIMTEVACQTSGTCNTDMLAFRAILARGFADLAAYGTQSNAGSSSESNSNWPQSIQKVLQTSAKGAAGQCSGGDNGTTCGMSWNSTTWDGTSGLGQDLSALEVILANLPRGSLHNVNSTGSSTTVTPPSSATTTPTASSSTSSTPAATTTAAKGNGVKASSVSSFSIAGAILFAVCMLL
ncbi:mannan endo-1,6-alpha-mannosidase dcw1 [Acrodontium crateriforme]|uniref:Mannan endo-1,6-alpha-mannosidase n=1 Tax=Acrodontium crateriforme TaxID=150365 RepID=A0AAQ3R8J3_9PEZI|nr:mannan endo-1,6-alpha-mannosidase dcw1 [Acrodontium crateriforme]